MKIVLNLIALLIAIVSIYYSYMDSAYFLLSLLFVSAFFSYLGTKHSVLAVHDDHLDYRRTLFGFTLTMKQILYKDISGIHLTQEGTDPPINGIKIIYCDDRNLEFSNTDFSYIDDIAADIAKRCSKQLINDR